MQQPAPAAYKLRKFKHLDWADCWIEFDRAYQAHHFNCPTCIAAGKGNGLRCGAGAALYRVYLNASADGSRLDW